MADPQSEVYNAFFSTKQDTLPPELLETGDDKDDVYNAFFGGGEKAEEEIIEEPSVENLAPAIEESGGAIPTPTDNADAILNTALQDPESIDETIANVTSSTPKSFDQKEFESSLNVIASQTRENLIKNYNTNNVQVKVKDKGFRSLDTQRKYLESGASQASLGLHNFGAAGDFDIWIDDKLMKADRGFSKDREHSVEPYTFLGQVAEQYGYFWGWEHDSGHVASHRFVNQLIEENPELADSEAA